MRRLALALLLMAGLAVWAMGDEDDYSFGTVAHFKDFPEFQRGLDPAAALGGGLLEERVDPYTGKLSLRLRLPGIPFSQGGAFEPALSYSGNLWGYRTPGIGKFTLDGELRRDPVQPDELDIPDHRLADYWGNDAWVRFSPIGRPHAQPGWTLATGGVYTEYVAGAKPIGGVEELCFGAVAAVEKKYFITPAGTSHALVDLATSGRPFFTTPFGQFNWTPPAPVCDRQCRTGVPSPTSAAT